ncbi:MAG: hypothetical protein JST92_11445 [Deltaproteobacteria bacterium]|nr:hypothetical protein [Deltaproteobacteria bacterium]
MTLALALAAGSALSGGALALLARGRPRLLEPVRTFAFAAAAAVVGLHLLPEALAALGGRALVYSLIGFALPGLLEAAGRALGRSLRIDGFSGARVSAEAGFLALVFHSLFEGLALEASLTAPGSQLDVALALVSHHAPLTAAVVLPFLALGGVRETIIRVLVIALAGVCGVWGTQLVPALHHGAAESGFVAVANAVLAGALLHVVVDEVEPQTHDTPRARLIDLGALAAGILLTTVGMMFESRPGAALTPIGATIRALATLALVGAPALLFGDLACAWMSAQRGPLTSRLARVFERFDPVLLLCALAFFGPAGLVALAAFALPFARLPQPLGKPSPDLLARFLDRADSFVPLRLLALVLGAGALVSLPSATHALEVIPAVVSSTLIVLFALGDGAAAILFGAAMVACGLSPVYALGSLAAGRLLVPLVRPQLQQVAEPQILSAFSGAIALVLIGRFWPGGLGIQPALMAVQEPLAAQFARSPTGALCLFPLAVISALAFWRLGGRGFFAPLRALAMHADEHA